MNMPFVHLKNVGSGDPWKIISDAMDTHDKTMFDGLREDLDTLLVFVRTSSLFIELYLYSLKTGLFHISMLEYCNIMDFKSLYDIASFIDFYITMQIPCFFCLYVVHELMKLPHLKSNTLQCWDVGVHKTTVRERTSEYFG